SLGVPVTVRPQVHADVRSASLSGALERRRAARENYEPQQSRESSAMRTARHEHTDMSRVFARSALTYRYGPAEGATHAQAQAAAERRIDSILDGNLQLARRLVEHQALEQANTVDLDRPIVGYRRIIHPEMSAGGVCGMCIVAADRTYKIGTLKAI